MTDVFISYKREERDRCEAIAEKLTAAGYDVWFDARLEAGTRFDFEIEEHIYKAKAVLVLWSERSVKSEWVRNEATIGQSRSVLVSAAIESCRLPINFVNTHTEKLFGNSADSDVAWQRILTRIWSLARPRTQQANPAQTEPPTSGTPILAHALFSVRTLEQRLRLIETNAVAFEKDGFNETSKKLEEARRRYEVLARWERDLRHLEADAKAIEESLVHLRSVPGARFRARIAGNDPIAEQVERLQFVRHQISQLEEERAREYENLKTAGLPPE